MLFDDIDDETAREIPDIGPSDFKFAVDEQSDYFFSDLSDFMCSIRNKVEKVKSLTFEDAELFFGYGYDD